jgi:hypothetical protein
MVMKRLWVWCLTVAALSPASAQLMQMMDREKMLAMPLMLLPNAAVQKELMLTGKQKDEIKKINEEFSKTMSGMQGRNDMAMLGQANQKLAETEQKLIAVLEEQQAIRFKEVRYQVLGMRSLGEPEVQSALALTEEQKTAVTAYEKASREGALSAMRSGPSALANWNKGRDKREEELAKILVPEQEAKLKSMFGAPFKDVKKVRG